MNSEISAVIVDDEEDARLLLVRLLKRIEGVRVVAHAAGVDEALEQIVRNRPEVVFLDIQMPEKNGFTLIQELRKQGLRTTVIFITAHGEFAIHALKVSAFDYLLKPVDFRELSQTVERYRTQKNDHEYEKKIDILLNCLQRTGKICFNTRTGYLYIAPEEIIFCEADVNYTTFIFGKERREVVTVNIGRIEEMLGQERFLRISRSHIINLEYLVKVDRRTKSCELIKQGEHYVIPVPPAQIRSIESHLKRNRES